MDVQQILIWAAVGVVILLLVFRGPIESFFAKKSGKDPLGTAVQSLKDHFDTAVADVKSHVEKEAVLAPPATGPAATQAPGTTIAAKRAEIAGQIKDLQKKDAELDDLYQALVKALS